MLQKTSKSSQRNPYKIPRNPQNKPFKSTSTNTDKFLNKAMKIHLEILQFISIITANLETNWMRRENFFMKRQENEKKSLTRRDGKKGELIYKSKLISATMKTSSLSLSLLLLCHLKDKHEVNCMKTFKKFFFFIFSLTQQHKLNCHRIAFNISATWDKGHKKSSVEWEVFFSRYIFLQLLDLLQNRLPYQDMMETNAEKERRKKNIPLLSSMWSLIFSHSQVLR